MLEDVYKDAEDQMQKALDSLAHEYTGIRTGRASVGLLDGITVEYYGSQMPLNQVATLSVPESSLIVIQPWDTTVLKAIEKAILRSDLGITPSNDGKVIRLAVPPLTEERREQLVKVVKKRAEEKRVAIRQIRRDSNEILKDLEKEKDITEDEKRIGQDHVQKITDKFIKKIDEITAKKEKELLEV
jgi:ribosome recycling factor